MGNDDSCISNIDGMGALMTWIAIKAQHVKDIPEIKEAIKNIFVRLFLWFSNVCALTMLLFEFFSSAPINRRDVFLIVGSTTLLFMALILNIVLFQIEMLKLYKEHFRATDQISDDLGRTIGIIESMHNEEDSPDRKPVR